MGLFKTRASSYTITMKANAMGRAGADQTIMEFTIEKGYMLPAGRQEIDLELGREATLRIRRFERRRGNDGHPSRREGDPE